MENPFLFYLSMANPLPAELVQCVRIQYDLDSAEETEGILAGVIGVLQALTQGVQVAFCFFNFLV